MSICPTCGRDDSPAVSKSEREITLRVPEWQFALFGSVLRRSNVQFGMMSYGELANQLRPFHDQFLEDSEHWRYLDDNNLAIAMTAIRGGLKPKVSFGPGYMTRHGTEKRVAITVTFKPGPGKEPIKLTVADSAPEATSDWFKTYIEDAAERLAAL